MFVPLGHRIIGHLLPTLNGLRRALSQTPFNWLITDISPIPISSAQESFHSVTTAISYEWDSSTLEGRTSTATLDTYSNSIKGLSAGFVNCSLLESQRVYLARVVSGENEQGWNDLLTSEKVRGKSSSSIDQRLVEQNLLVSLSTWDQTLKSLEDDSDDSLVMDPYSFDILQQSLVCIYSFFLIV